jgi:hypothetical protein
MSEVVARCPDCGNEQPEEFANCFVCMKPSRWWCVGCLDWRPVRACRACGPRLEFIPAAILLRSPNPGGTICTSVALKNTGKVPLTATLSTNGKWLSAEPKRLTLSPGESAAVKLRAKSKKTDSGKLEAKLTADAPGGPYEIAVLYTLPDPELSADPVDFGELQPGRAAHAAVVLRNTGRVRVACAIAPAHPWLRAVPSRVSLPPGREKKLRVRATLADGQDGPQRSELVISSEVGVVLRVPVSATGRVPKPVLRAVRKQVCRNAVGPPVERRFQVANDGDGHLDVTATADKPWVKVLTTELRVGPGKKRRLRYELDIPSLPCGEHNATISLTSNGGGATVPVTVHVLEPNPVLEVVPAPNLGTITPDVALCAFVQVRNAGIGLLTVRAQSESPRVTVTPAEAGVTEGPPVRFNLHVPVAGLPGGEHEVGVRFTGNGGEGRSVLRFRLPVEVIDAPALIDLGDRAAGRAAGDAVRIRNIGPDGVTLRLRGEHQWIRPGAERISVEPGETVAVPFRIELPAGAYGPVMTSLVLEGRSVSHTAAVRAVARKVELRIMPGEVELGGMAPNEERAFTVEVVNAGELPAVIHESHARGDLEVWVRPATVKPGERVVVAGRVRANAKQPHRQLRATVRLADEVGLSFTATVVPSIVPKVAAVGAAAGGLLAGTALGVMIAWWVGIPLVLLGFATGAWLFWLDMA